MVWTLPKKLSTTCEELRRVFVNFPATFVVSSSRIFRWMFGVLFWTPGCKGEPCVNHGLTGNCNPANGKARQPAIDIMLETFQDHKVPAKDQPHYPPG